MGHEDTGYQSRLQGYEDGKTLSDWRTAHGYKEGDTVARFTFAPETCRTCAHQRTAAEEEGRPTPTEVDQEYD